eukprot:scpid90494/ scgid34916/ 
MHWYEILALDALRLELQRRLATVVDETVDELLDAGIFDRRDLDYVKISTSPTASIDRVNDLIKYLLRVERKSRNGTFNVFCSVLRERLGLEGIADCLEREAKKCEETMTEGDVPGCDLVLSMETLEELVERKVAESHANTQVTESRHVQTCLQVLRENLSSANKFLCNTVDDGGSDLSCLTSDIRSCFVPLQAMSEKDAMRVTYQHHRRHSMATALQQKQHALGVSGSGGRGQVVHRRDEDEDVHGGKEFVLETAVQLLTGEAAQATSLNHGVCAGRTAAAAAA